VKRGKKQGRYSQAVRGWINGMKTKTPQIDRVIHEIPEEKGGKRVTYSRDNMAVKGGGAPGLLGAKNRSLLRANPYRRRTGVRREGTGAD